MVSKLNVIEVTNNTNRTCLTVTIVECDVIEMNEAVMKVVKNVNHRGKMMKYHMTMSK